MLLFLLLACLGTHEEPSETESTPTASATESEAEGEETVCGDLTCSVDELCYRVTGGVPDTAGEAVVTYSCEPLPEGCDGSCTCACDEVGGDCTVPEGGGRLCVLAAP